MCVKRGSGEAPPGEERVPRAQPPGQDTHGLGSSCCTPAGLWAPSLRPPWHERPQPRTVSWWHMVPNGPLRPVTMAKIGSRPLSMLVAIELGALVLFNSNLPPSMKRESLISCLSSSCHEGPTESQHFLRSHLSSGRRGSPSLEGVGEGKHGRERACG